MCGYVDEAKTSSTACPICAAQQQYFVKYPFKALYRATCNVCGYVYEAAPGNLTSCPQCKSSDWKLE